MNELSLAKRKTFHLTAEWWAEGHNPREDPGLVTAPGHHWAPGVSLTSDNAHLCGHRHWSPDKCSGPWHTPPRGPGARNTRSRRPRISSTPGGHEVTDKAWDISELYLDILEVRADPARVRPLAPAQDGDHATGAGLARSREPDGRYLAGDLRQGRSNERPACHCCFLHQYQLVAGQWPSHLPRLTDHIRDGGCN